MEAYCVKIWSEQSNGNPDDLIAITGGMNPQQLYFAHRKGWKLESDDFLNNELILQLKGQGCKYLFVHKQDLDSKLDYPVVYADDHYIIYTLAPLGCNHDSFDRV